MTGNVTREDVDQMERLRRIMEGGEDGDGPPSDTQSQNTGTDVSQQTWDPNSTPAGVTGEDVNWMKNIMERFESGAGEMTQNLAEESKTNSRLNEAMQTERTDRGARIGSWEIQQNVTETESGKSKKYYDVYNTATGEPIARDLLIYEAAHALVKLLNRGETLTDQSVRDVLRLEENFSRAYYDAAQHKSRHKKHLREGRQEKADLYEARFDASRQQALDSKEKLKKVLRKL